MPASSASRLTNDYINHFGELVMLLEMLPDCPHLIEEARSWTPRSYPEHLEKITFAAIGPLREGYAGLDPDRRAMLDQTADDANRLGVTIAAVLADANLTAARLTEITRVGCAAMHAHIRRLSAILAGKPLPAIDRDCDIQAEIDALLAAS
jgi:hypothetical protein